jgi:hypothetical protein
MTQRSTQIMLAATGVFFLLCSACKQPIQPEEPKLNFDEPDTIKSSISFILNSPLRHFYRWELRTPVDTLSRGAVTSTGVLTRRDVWLIGGVSFVQNLTDNSWSLICAQSSELLTEDIVREDNQMLDALRSAREAELYLSFFYAPKSISIPLKINHTFPDTTFNISFKDRRFQEYIVPSNSPGSAIVKSFVSSIFADVQYSPIYLRSIDTSFYDPASLNRYRTRLEQMEMILDRYDTIRQRVDGRFSFRMVGYGNAVVEVKEGRFTNVRLNRIRN